MVIIELVTDIQHNSMHYKPGDRIQVHDDIAAQLIAAGVAKSAEQEPITSKSTKHKE